MDNPEAGKERPGAAVAAGGPGDGPRSLGVTAASLMAWLEAFLAAGEVALVTRPESGEALESERPNVKLGEVIIERDLPREKIALLEAGRPLARRRPRP